MFSAVLCTARFFDTSWTQHIGLPLAGWILRPRTTFILSLDASNPLCDVQNVGWEWMLLREVITCNVVNTQRSKYVVFSAPVWVMCGVLWLQNDYLVSSMWLFQSDMKTCRNAVLGQSVHPFRHTLVLCSAQPHSSIPSEHTTLDCNLLVNYFNPRLLWSSPDMPTHICVMVRRDAKNT